MREPCYTRDCARVSLKDTQITISTECLPEGERVVRRCGRNYVTIARKYRVEDFRLVSEARTVWA